MCIDELSLRTMFGFILVLLAGSCSISQENPLSIKSEFVIDDKFFKGKVTLSKLESSNGFRILLIDSKGEKSDQTIFKYHYYQFDTADINRDGHIEILVGLIKQTEFDPEEKKRLFILRIDEGQLRPLWLGSKVCQELINFKTMDGGVVQTLEKTKKGNYAIGRYVWQGFGLTLINYIHDEKNHSDAIKLFDS